MASNHKTQNYVIRNLSPVILLLR